MYLTDLADAARKSGLPVVEVDGWRTRCHGPMTAVETIACHHTATSKAASGNYPSLGIVRDGRSDLPGPLAQLGLGRDGAVYVIAAGVCYHAGTVLSTAYDNWHAIGIEAEHDGISPWPEAQVAAYARLVAALAEHYDVPTARVLGHKEICSPLGRKSDPNFDMDQFRRLVIDANQEDIMTPQDIEQIAQRTADVLEERLGDDSKRLGKITRAVRALSKQLPGFDFDKK